MATQFELGASLDQILSNLPIGSMERAIGDSLYGYNARHKNVPIPKAKDSYGYTFFTRPQLNLQDSNISNYRKMFSMLSSRPTSYQRYFRMMLDPRLGYLGMKCPLLNNENAFIPILGNSLVSLSGFPDLAVSTFESDPGAYQERFGYIDGILNYHDSYDITYTAKNTRGSPIPYAMNIWIEYATLVLQAIMNPYMDMITENEIDYTTRIYRIVTDDKNRYVTHIAAPGYAIPTSLTTGALFDVNVDKPYTDAVDTLSYRFKCFGFMFDEDVIKLEFNQVQAIFNPAIRRLLAFDQTSNNREMRQRESLGKIYEHSDAGLIKIPHSLLGASEVNILGNHFNNLNYNMIPYINLYTNELEWWTSIKNYKP